MDKLKKKRNKISKLDWINAKETAPPLYETVYLVFSFSCHILHKIGYAYNLGDEIAVWVNQEKWEIKNLRYWSFLDYPNSMCRVCACKILSENQYCSSHECMREKHEEIESVKT